MMTAIYDCDMSGQKGAKAGAPLASESSRLPAYRVAFTVRKAAGSPVIETPPQILPMT
jgi:hypothetical protein